MNQKERRKQKGKIIDKHEGKLVQGKRKGQFEEKNICTNELQDVINWKNQGRTREEIYDLLCERYGHRDYNPVVDRYLEYINENNL